MAITVPVDGAIISAGVFGKPVADALNGDKVMRTTFNGNVQLDATGRVVIAITYTPVFAICYCAQPAYPRSYSLVSISATQVIWQCHMPDGSNSGGNAIVGVMYAIWGNRP